MKKLVFQLGTLRNSSPTKQFYKDCHRREAVLVKIGSQNCSTINGFGSEFHHKVLIAKKEKEE